MRQPTTARTIRQHNRPLESIGRHDSATAGRVAPTLGNREISNLAASGGDFTGFLLGVNRGIGNQALQRLAMSEGRSLAVQRSDSDSDSDPAEQSALHRPVRPQTAEMAIDIGGSSFPTLTWLKHKVDPRKDSDSLRRADELAPHVRAFNDDLKDSVSGYRAAQATSGTLDAVSKGLTLASVVSSATGFAAPAGAAFGIASGAATMASGAADHAAATTLRDRPKSPTRRGDHQRVLLGLQGDRKLVSGAASLTGLPGAGFVAGQVHDATTAGTREHHAVGLVEGVRKQAVASHGRRAAEAANAAAAAASGPAMTQKEFVEKFGPLIPPKTLRLAQIADYREDLTAEEGRAFDAVVESCPPDKDPRIEFEKMRHEARQTPGQILHGRRRNI